MFGYGAFQIGNDETKHCVQDAPDSGCRLIDTAQAYGNEESVGEGIKEFGVNRDDIFLVDRVWITNYGEGNVYDSIKESLKKLGTDYIDLVLLHQAYSDYHAAWRDMECAYKAGLVRSIGVFNFPPVRLAGICAFSDVAPMVNQVETHVFWQQKLAHGKHGASGCTAHILESVC